MWPAGIRSLRPFGHECRELFACKIGAKVVSHGRYVAFQMAEVAIPRILFADILRLASELRPPPIASM
jgi:hypothetical protein